MFQIHLERIVGGDIKLYTLTQEQDTWPAKD